MSETMLEGGCHCGAVRYRVPGKAAYVAFCHCTDCRGTSGAPMVPWAGYPDDDFTLIRGEPARYASSEKVERRFCGACGTQLVYKNQEEDTLDITLASLDDPEALRPECHVFTRSRLDWVRLADGLPRFPGWKSEGHQEEP